MKFRFSNTPIATQFRVLFTLVFIVPILSLGIFFFFEFSRIQDDTLKELEYVAGLQKTQVEAYVHALTQTLFSFYQDEEIRDAISAGNQASLLAVLEEKLEGDSTVLALTLMDDQVRIHASTDSNVEGVTDRKQAFTRGQTAFGLHQVSFQEGKLIGVLSGPYVVGEAFSGVLLVDVDLSSITELQDAFANLSVTGEFILVQAVETQVELLTPSRFTGFVSPIPLSASHNVEVWALNNAPQSLRDVQDYRGERVFAATAYLPTLDWGLVVKKDRTEVLVPIVKMYRAIFLAVAVSLLLLTLISWYLRRHILFPIQELTRAAKRIQKGTYQGTLDIRTTNEVGSLARAFKAMSEELIETNETLEEQVKHRTSRLRRTLQDIRTQKQRDDALLSSIVEGMVATDARSIIILVNEAACQMFGQARKALVGMPLRTFLRVRSLDGQPLEKGKSPIAQVVKHQRVLKRVEYLAKRKNGEAFPLQISASPVTVDGKRVGAIFTLHDLTKEKEVDRLKSEFISIASHQLRAPLASMKWYGELLAKGKAGKLRKEQALFVDRLNTSTYRTISLVDDFLNASRLEKGELRNVPKRVPVRELLEGILLTFDAQISEKKLIVDVQVRSRRKTVWADPELLREVLSNLIGNAVKYTREKGRVNVLVRDLGKRMRFEVEDSGIGIPKEEQAQLFEKFYRGNYAAKLGFGGTGLGLYTVKRLVDQLGGTTGFTSEEGKGSTFWIEM